MIDYFLYLIGKICRVSKPINKILSSAFMRIYSGYLSLDFKRFGHKSKIKPFLRMLVGAKYMEIGENCLIGKNVQLTAYDYYEEERFNPEVVIGDNTVIGDSSHITAINSILIGKNVLTGRNILISDNSHGALNKESLLIAPIKRRLVSKGAVVIEDDVWIGEKASIMANVRIGKGSIVAANSVVTKDVPPYCLVAGCPAIIKKKF